MVIWGLIADFIWTDSINIQAQSLSVDIITEPVCISVVCTKGGVGGEEWQTMMTNIMFIGNQIPYNVLINTECMYIITDVFWYRNNYIFYKIISNKEDW